MLNNQVLKETTFTLFPYGGYETMKWLFVKYLRPRASYELLQSLQAHRPPSTLLMSLILSLNHLGLQFLLCPPPCLSFMVKIKVYSVSGREMSLFPSYDQQNPAVYIFCGSVFLWILITTFTEVFGTEAFSLPFTQTFYFLKILKWYLRVSLDTQVSFDSTKRKDLAVD